MAPRKRKSARSSPPAAKAVPLAQLMDVAQVRELVEREAADGFRAPKNATCRIGKRLLTWSIRFQRKSDDGTHVREHRFHCPNPGAGD